VAKQVGRSAAEAIARLLRQAIPQAAIAQTVTAHFS
jgi:hypothetical protein